MALPTMRPGITGREFVRVAGGYGAAALGTSPAGGLDIDNAGNLATDGDVTASSVAIGTSTPAEKLHVLSTANETAGIEAESTSAGTAARGLLKATGDGGSIQVMQHGTGRTNFRYGVPLSDMAEILANGAAGLLIGSQEAVDIIFGTNSAERMRIDSSGNVGIGATPTEPLHVAVTNTARKVFFHKNINGASAPVVRIRQDHISGGQSCLDLDQDDISEGFIEFTGSDRGVITTSTTNSVAAVRVELNGTKYIIPLFTDAWKEKMKWQLILRQ